MYKVNDNSRALAKELYNTNKSFSICAKIMYNTCAKALYFPRPVTFPLAFAHRRAILEDV